MTDITYIRAHEGWLYLAGIKDLHTCEIVGYALGERMTKELVSRALFGDVSHKRPPPGLIHHSDRGSQYLRARPPLIVESIWHAVLDEPQRQLLRQRADGKLLGHAQE